MSDERIFGYGSLVNAATHNYGTLHPATLSGWRRIWHYTTSRDLAYLSVTPDAHAQIKGVILNAPHQDAALQNREQAYQRHAISHQTTHNLPDTQDIHVFAIPETIHTPPTDKSALLLSYIDVVVQGYFQLFGEVGVQEFFATTHGWGARVLNDRAAPLYPRHQSLSKQEQTLVDTGLSSLPATIIRR